LRQILYLTNSTSSGFEIAHDLIAIIL
jgi:hypothetical protein